MSDLLVLAPLRVEAIAIRSAARALRVRTTGMGPRRARAAAASMLDDPAAALLVIGFGGGLSYDSELGEVVVAERVVVVDEHGGREGPAVPCAGVDALASALSEHGLAVRRGTVASVQEIVTGQERARMLASGALAVDMESAWLAQAARDRPFAVVRIISDTPLRELRHRLPVGPPLPSIADGLRAAAALRSVAGALGRLIGERGVHTVFGPAI
jgi:4-hydroxy-3-methylbut-2-en-1-yl diphosphate reductase